jgi:hypothetical protein
MVIYVDIVIFRRMTAATIKGLSVAGIEGYAVDVEVYEPHNI